MATEKQINYALMLLGKAGYGTRFMDASYKELGATMRQRSGNVRDWLASMDRSTISQIIERLKGGQS